MDRGASIEYRKDIPAADIHVVARPRPGSPALEERLIGACSDAVRPRRCILSTAGAASPPSASAQFVTRNTVHVTFRDADGTVTTREASFRDEDPEAERWQTIALIVASLAGERSAAAPAPPPAQPPRVTWLTVAAETGDGVEPGPVRFGGSFRLAFRPRGFIGYAVAGAGLSSSQAIRSGIRPSLLPLSLGAGLMFELESGLALRPRVDAILERQHAGVTDGRLAPSSGTRWMPGLGMTLELVFPDRGPVSLVFGVNARYATGATGIYVDQERIASFPAHSYGMHLGLDVGLDGLFGIGRD